MESGLKGRVVLITGAGGGIGRATALAFANEGWGRKVHAGQPLAPTDGSQTLLFCGAGFWLVLL